MSCPDDNHVDDGSPACARCGAVLLRVRQAVAARLKCGDAKRGRGRCVRPPNHAGDHDNGAGGTWAIAPAKPGRRRRRARKQGTGSRWSWLETD